MNSWTLILGNELADIMAKAARSLREKHCQFHMAAHVLKFECVPKIRKLYTEELEKFMSHNPWIENHK